MAPKNITPLQENSDFKQFKDLISRTLSFGNPDEQTLKKLFDLFDQDRDGKLNKTEVGEFNKKVVEKINNLKTAFIVVDLQNDFMAEKGALLMTDCPAKEDPLEVIPAVNTILKRHKEFEHTIFTVEWHPPNHISFADHMNDSDRTLGDQTGVEFPNVAFTNPKVTIPLMPPHCVQDSWGAKVHKDLLIPEGSVTVPKAFHVFVETHSGFGLEGFEKTELEAELRKKNIDALFLCGVAGDICVPDTVVDGLKLGFHAAILEDLIRSVDKDRAKHTREEMIALGVPYVHSKAIFEYLDERRVPWDWVKNFAGLK